jgi:signal transduction histidine kinase
MPTTLSSDVPALDGAVSLRNLPLFSDLADEDLERLYSMAGRLSVRKGERFIEEGAAGDALYVILEGGVEITRREGQREIALATRGRGEFIGEMSLLEKAPRTASARALQDTELLVISQTAFQTLLSCSPSAPVTLLRTVADRLRSTESLLMQQQKLAALGTLAAGLAHELNNPAAAIRASAAYLREALRDLEAGTSALRTAAPAHAHAELDALLERVAAPASGAPILDGLTSTAREDEVEDWLTACGVDKPWEAAAVLVGAGWDTAALENLGDGLPQGLLLDWLVAATTVFGLIDEVSQSARAISDIVHAAKTYSYLDEAPVQEVDVHQSLESTLVILKHKLKTGIRVAREYQTDLPPIEAYGSELNQVWTNLIDNAVDAMNGEGELRLRTYAKRDRVVVEIQDSGPGIPVEIQHRLFDPFFTTKPPGVGSGLGLHLAHNIVVQRHHGQIHVASEPGFTCFRVTLPVGLAARIPEAG